ANEYGGMGDKLGEAVHKALGVVQDAVSSARSFGDSVERAETDLADYTDEKKVRAAIVSLMRATREMSKRTRSMTGLARHALQDRARPARNPR
ncbi:MAG: hypothetical protein AAF499_19905, partial [Pseudomonadota bacterium]